MPPADNFFGLLSRGVPDGHSDEIFRRLLLRNKRDPHIRAESGKPLFRAAYGRRARQRAAAYVGAEQESMRDLKSIVALNLVNCRKSSDMTQLQVAEKLNYSDKAVSKWERGESLPDISVLVALAKLYDVTLDYLVTEHPPKRSRFGGAGGRLRKIIFLIAACLIVFFLATVCFCLLYLFAVPGRIWMAFIYALPVCGVIAVVFSCVWGNKWDRTISVSFLIWTLALTIFLALNGVPEGWVVFVVAFPLQILTVLWFFFLEKREG